MRADDKLTIPACVQACQGAGYAYAGLEYGRECWCGRAPAPNLEDASDPQCAMQCDMPCGGNPSVMCGGRAAIAIYQNTARKRGLDGGNDDDVDAAGEEQGGAKDARDHRNGSPGTGATHGRKGRFVKTRHPEMKEAVPEAE